MLGAFPLALMFTVVAASPETAAIDRCRSAWKNLDAEGAIASCAQAGAATDTAKSDRVEGYRDLGQAFVLQGRIDLAEDAFRSMLSLDPTATLGDDAGPKAQAALAHVIASIPKPAPPPAPPPAPAAPAPSSPVAPPAAPVEKDPAASTSGHSYGVGAIAIATVATVMAAGALLGNVGGQASVAQWSRGAADPLVFLDKGADPALSGWGQNGYGAEGERGLPNEAARFTMVAVSLKNERQARDGVNLTVGVAAGSAVVAVVAVVAAVALWPE